MNRLGFKIYCHTHQEFVRIHDDVTRLDIIQESEDDNKIGLDYSQFWCAKNDDTGCEATWQVEDA